MRELIKQFNNIRDYMREFFINGFKSREDYHYHSPRTYDEARFRIDSWLGEYLESRADENRRRINYFSIDSRNVVSNPLHKAFKTSSFTDNDITIYFCLMDCLSHGDWEDGSLLINSVHDHYAMFGNDGIDPSTIRKKLSEYTRMGILQQKKKTRSTSYRLNQEIKLTQEWLNAAAFFSEDAPVGVAGSYLMDFYDFHCDMFRFKHHHLFQTLDSEILCTIFEAMEKCRWVDITYFNIRTQKDDAMRVYPIRVYESTQNGTQHLAVWTEQNDAIYFLRFDRMKKVKLSKETADSRWVQQMEAKYKERKEHFWGVSQGNGQKQLEHVRMVIYAGQNEPFIVNRLYREKRWGTVEKLSDTQYQFSIDVYDSRELLPWIRSFIGRIEELECPEPVKMTFLEDVKAACALYREQKGDDGAVS